MEDPNQPYKLATDQQALTREDVMAMIADAFSNQSGPQKLINGFFQSQNFVTGVSGWQLTDNSAEFNVGVNVSSINIPDQTTANSFHVDSSGNAWWGANVATGYTGGNAYILNTGAAVFKNVQIGGTTIQYVIQNSGIFSFGDGSDGNATCDGSTAVAGMSRSGSTYTMTRDVYFNNLTINSSVTVLPSGYRIFVKDTLTVNGTISRNGNAGSAGGDNPGWDSGGNGAGTGGGASGGAALSDGYLKGTVAGAAGGQGGRASRSNTGGAATTAGNTGATGTGVVNALGTDGVSGGAGASSEAGGGSGGGAGTVTISNVKLIANWHLATLLDISSTGSTVKFTGHASGGGGGGGGGGGAHGINGNSNGNGGPGGDGGGSGSPGGILAIYARSIVVGAAGSILSTGGAGGKGGNGGNAVGGFNNDANTGGGGGGGGASGNGGIIILTYNNLTNSGSVAAAAGTPGAGGTGGSGNNGAASGGTGTTGNTGSAGIIYQFQLSL